MERCLLFLWEATSNWKLSKKELKEFTFFTLAEAIDTTNLVFRANNGKSAMFWVYSGRIKVPK
jgi:hypothetical protein